MHELHLHNNLTRRKERFEPLDPQHVRMYVCGATVYDLVHIGNARPEVVYDVLARLLRRLYPRVTYVRNITDVEDKINARAKELGEPISALTARTIDDYHADMAALASLPPDVEPRATDHIAEMIAMIEKLIASGHAYAAEGHVLFSVPSYPAYGRLSGRSPDELLAGARIDVAPYKRDPGDFVLWKPSTPDLPGWDSPWGRGRPGWHIECSAMSWRYLGETFDIHGGGSDLIFPHHENELAQSLALGHEFARIWMHNGMIGGVDGEKMSKSLGNDISLRNVLDTWGREVVLLFFLGAHWRKPVEFGDDVLVQAKAQADAFRNFFLDEGSGDEAGETVLEEELAAVLDDDFNTPEALALFHGWRDREEWTSLRWGLGLFGLGSLAEVDQAPPEVGGLAERRRAAREAGDFAEADRLRDEIAAAGWEARDVAEPPGYRLVRRT